MLPERYCALLTAYVDGELGARQRRHVQRLLHRSAEARRLLERLQSDSRTLRDLPRPRLDRDLSEVVLHKIAASRPIPLRRARRFTPARAYPAWVGAAAAAAVLFVVGTVSYCCFSVLNRPAAPSVVAMTHERPDDSPEVKPPADIPGEPAPAPRPVPDVPNNPGPAPRPPAEDVAHHTPDDPNPPSAPEKDDPVFTSERMEMFTELKAISPSLDVPAAFKLRDLEQDAVHKKLLAELQKDAAMRLELPCSDGSRAFERLQSVFKAHHVELTLDATAQARLAKPAPKYRTNYVLYTEELTAEELAQLLRQLGAEDKKEKRPAENPFDALVVRRMTERDHKELSDLLGVDPVQTQPKDVGPLGVDPRKPVSDQTAAQVAAALAGRPGKPGARAMLALPYNPVRPKRDSAEVKRFLEERKPLRPGALQVLLVLRGPNG